MSATSTLSAVAVKQLLQQDILHCQQLLSLLQSEHETLQTRDTSQLKSLIESKQALMVRLENGAKQRSRWLQLASGDAEFAKLPQTDQWMALLQAFAEPDLLQLWNDLETSLASCKIQNETNGRIIHKGQRTLQKLVGLMRGKINVSPGTYNAKGMADAGRGGHTSVKA